jgi:hypothetical protein
MSGRVGGSDRPGSAVSRSFSRQTWAAPAAGGGVVVTWDATADPDSVLRQFIIRRDGREVGRVPERPAGKYGRPLFQGLSYHDTPEPPLPVMRFVDTTAGAATRAEYRVIAVNGVGRESEPSEADRAPDAGSQWWRARRRAPRFERLAVTPVGLGHRQACAGGSRPPSAERTAWADRPRKTRPMVVQSTSGWYGDSSTNRRHHACIRRLIMTASRVRSGQVG